jgi:hypothetical protein
MHGESKEKTKEAANMEKERGWGEGKRMNREANAGSKR